MFETFGFQLLVSWDVLNSCSVSKLLILFPVGAAKSTTLWWAFALLCLERGRSWHGVVWSCLKSEKDDTASLCTVVCFWKVWISGLVFFFPWERKLKCLKIHLLVESLDGVGGFGTQVSTSVRSLSFLCFSVSLPLTWGVHKILVQTKGLYSPFKELWQELQIKQFCNNWVSVCTKTFKYGYLFSLLL